MKAKYKVLLTGATGIMGQSVLKELSHHLDLIDLRLLIYEDRIPKSISPITNNNKSSIEIVYGDLRNYDTILKCVTGVDYILHVGGMVYPICDKFPKETQEVNVGGMKNICQAVLAQENKDSIKVCYIGSVAETGGRNYPIHFGRIGDPINISIYDHYGLSKAMAEKTLVESDVKNWVVLRMSGIIHPALFNNISPIVMHIVINGGIEWCTQEDSGRLLRQLVLLDIEGKLGKNFWNHMFNVSSGKEYRLSNYEFERYMLKGSGLPEPREVFEPNWFITKNFHGHYFLDSDKLEEILHFRQGVPVDEYFKILSKKVPFMVKLGKFVSAKIMKFYMRSIARTKVDGTLDWIDKNDEKKIKAYFGSMEEYKKIPTTWEEFKLIDLNVENPKLLDHGYDDKKPESEIDIEDVRKAAKFRGGKLLSEHMEKGDLRTKLKWKCGYCKSEFDASPCLILLGGFWCPNCYIPENKWDYDNIAKTCPFFAQIWYNDHSVEDNNVFFFKEMYQEGKVKFNQIYK